MIAETRRCMAADFQKYKYQIKYVRQLEFEIACKNNKMHLYIKKWNPVKL
jgi:hypothetical protein